MTRRKSGRAPNPQYEVSCPSDERPFCQRIMPTYGHETNFRDAFIGCNGPTLVRYVERADGGDQHVAITAGKICGRQCLVLAPGEKLIDHRTNGVEEFDLTDEFDPDEYDDNRAGKDFENPALVVREITVAVGELGAAAAAIVAPHPEMSSYLPAGRAFVIDAEGMPVGFVPPK